MADLSVARLTSTALQHQNSILMTGEKHKDVAKMRVVGQVAGDHFEPALEWLDTACFDAPPQPRIAGGVASQLWVLKRGTSAAGGCVKNNFLFRREEEDFCQ